MTWTVKAHTIIQNAASGFTTSAVDTTGADLLIACMDWHSGGIPAVSDSKSNTWTQAVTRATSISRDSGRIYYSTPTTVGTGHTFTMAGAGNGMIAFLALSGSVASPLDVTNNSEFIGDGTTKTRSPGSVTPSQSGEFCLAFYTIDDPSGNTFSVDSGFTILDSVDDASGSAYGGVVAYLAQGAAAAINPVLTRSVAGTAGHGDISLIATFKGSAPPSQTVTPSFLYSDTDSINVLTASAFNTFNPGLIASDEIFNAPAVAAIAAALPALVADSDTIPASTLSALTSITPILYADGEIVLGANVAAIGEALLVAGLLNDADVCYTPNIANILQFLRSALLADRDRFYAQQMTGGNIPAISAGVLTGTIERRPTLTGTTGRRSVLTGSLRH